MKAVSRGTYEENVLKRTVEGLIASPIDETATGRRLTVDEINESTRRQELNAMPLIEWLRSEVEISPAVRLWLADLLEGKRDVKLVLVPNTNTRPKHTRLKHRVLRRHAALYAAELREKYGDDQWSRSLKEAALEYRIDSTSIDEAVKLQEQMRMNMPATRTFRSKPAPCSESE